jgi:hypothetical protein
MLKLRMECSMNLAHLVEHFIIYTGDQDSNSDNSTYSL